MKASHFVDFKREMCYHVSVAGNGYPHDFILPLHGAIIYCGYAVYCPSTLCVRT